MQPKVLDQEALAFIRERRQEKAGYQTIADELNIVGYTNPTGGKLHMAQVSSFACANGIRTYKQRVKKEDGMPSHNVKEIAEFIRTCRLRKFDYVTTSKKLNRAGYTTVMGLKFNHNRVADFIHHNKNLLGDVVRTKRTKGMAKPVLQSVSYEGTPSPVEHFDRSVDVVAVIASNLPKHLKVKLLSEMV